MTEVHRPCRMTCCATSSARHPTHRGGCGLAICAVGRPDRLVRRRLRCSPMPGRRLRDAAARRRGTRPTGSASVRQGGARIGDRYRAGELGAAPAGAAVSRELRGFLHQATGVPRGVHADRARSPSSEIAPAAPVLEQLDRRPVQRASRGGRRPGHARRRGADPVVDLTWMGRRDRGLRRAGALHRGGAAAPDGRRAPAAAPDGQRQPADHAAGVRPRKRGAHAVAAVLTDRAAGGDVRLRDRRRGPARPDCPPPQRHSTAAIPRTSCCASAGPPTDPAASATLRYFAEHVDGLRHPAHRADLAEPPRGAADPRLPVRQGSLRDVRRPPAWRPRPFAPGCPTSTTPRASRTCWRCASPGFPTSTEAAAQRRSLIYVGPGELRAPGERGPRCSPPTGSGSWRPHGRRPGQRRRHRRARRWRPRGAGPRHRGPVPSRQTPTCRAASPRSGPTRPRRVRRRGRRAAATPTESPDVPLAIALLAALAAGGAAGGAAPMTFQPVLPLLGARCASPPRS